eukprot:6479420-Amphidinium_carterae.1
MPPPRTRPGVSACATASRLLLAPSLDSLVARHLRSTILTSHSTNSISKVMAPPSKGPQKAASAFGDGTSFSQQRQSQLQLDLPLEFPRKASHKCPNALKPRE